MKRAAMVAAVLALVGCGSDAVPLMQPAPVFKCEAGTTPVEQPPPTLPKCVTDGGAD